MSRLGKKVIALPQGVAVSVDGRDIEVSGPKGKLSWRLVKEIDLALGDDGLTVSTKSPGTPRGRAMWGLGRALLNSMVVGVSQGFERRLEISGVGYRATAQGEAINLSLGFSHPVTYTPRSGISLSVPRPTEIVVSGIDKQKVGQTAAEIRAFRPPDRYQGKGVRYSGEKIVLRDGKKKK